MVMNSLYTFRKSVLEKPQRWELSDQDISCSQEAGINVKIPFTQMEKVRLFYHPNNRFRLNNYCCKITLKNQAVYDIYSCTYNGFATFGNQAENYVPFVKELVQKVKTVNPDCKILTGHTPFTYYGNILFVFVAVSFLFLFFYWLPVNFRNFSIIVKLIVIVYLGAYLAKSISVNKPRRLYGNEIPDYVLPQLPKPETKNIS